jgi:hypothetical protein
MNIAVAISIGSSPMNNIRPIIEDVIMDENLQDYILNEDRFYIVLQF